MKKTTALFLAVVFAATAAVAADGYTLPNVPAKPAVFNSVGPYGEPASWYGDMKLTADELQKIKSMNLRFAFEAPTESEFGNAEVRGFSDTCRDIGIKVVGEAYCDLDPSRQKENMENFMALGVQGIGAQPQETGIAPQTFNPLVAKGIKLALIGTVPEGYVAGKDYTSMVTSELEAQGEQAADRLAETIGYKGDIAAIIISSVNFVSNTRDGAFRRRIKEKYPEINLVEEAGIEVPKDAGPAASALLTRHPGIKGMFVTFSTPCVEALESVRNLGAKDLKITTVDLDTICALDMVNGGNVVGIAVDSPYSLGQTGALALAYGVLGKDCPPFLVSPAIMVTADNIKDAWMFSMGQELPREITEALK